MTTPTDSVRHRPVGLRRTVVVFLAVLGLTLRPAPADAAPLDRDPETLAEVLDSFGYRPEHADVLRLYAAFFEREPDPAGALYWMRQFDDGASLDDLAWSFSASTEFVTAYGGSLTNAEFLTVVYSNVLHRGADQSGFDYWLGQMGAGLAQHQVVRWVTANNEFKARFAFVGTAPSLAGALAVATDYGPDWSTDHASVGDDPQRCSQLTELPVGAITRRIEGERDFRFHRSDHGLYAFATIDAAAAFVAQRLAFSLSCDGAVSASGSSNRIRPAGIGAVADERSGYVVSLVLNGIESANGAGVIMARRGNVVSITIDGSSIGYDRSLHEEIQVATVLRLNSLAS